MMGHQFLLVAELIMEFHLINGCSLIGGWLKTFNQLKQNIFFTFDCFAKYYYSKFIFSMART